MFVIFSYRYLAIGDWKCLARKAVLSEGRLSSFNGVKYEEIFAGYVDFSDVRSKRLHSKKVIS